MTQRRPTLVRFRLPEKCTYAEYQRIREGLQNDNYLPDSSKALLLRTFDTEWARVRAAQITEEALRSRDDYEPPFALVPFKRKR